MFNSSLIIVNGCKNTELHLLPSVKLTKLNPTNICVAEQISMKRKGLNLTQQNLGRIGIKNIKKKVDKIQKGKSTTKRKPGDNLSREPCTIQWKLRVHFW